MAVPPEVQYGLCTQQQFDTIARAISRNDVKLLAETAVPLCEENVSLFGAIFLGRDPNPSIWAREQELRRYSKVLVRMPRFGGKTTRFTTDEIMHDVAYSVFPESRFADGRLVAAFETRARADERLEPVLQAFESGGPGGLLGAVFRGQPGTRYEGMTIPEMAAGKGCSWSTDHITLPHPAGRMKADPNVKSMTPREATVGYHSTKSILDDIVGEKSANSAIERGNILRWFKYALRPTIKPYTRVLVPHTVYHPDDINEWLRKNGDFYLLEVKALNRKPSNDDFVEKADENGVITIEPTASGRTLKSYWPCPTHDDWSCPNTELHIREVGQHRSVRHLMMDFRTDPISFYQQWMHMLVNTEGASIKRWMLRFYVKNPNDHRIGSVANYHEKWHEWHSTNPDAGIPPEPPRVVCFTADGVFDKKGSEPTTVIEACKHGWDLAIGKEASHDRTACCRLYRTKDKRFFASYRAGRWGHDSVWKMIVTHAMSDPLRKPDEVVVEANNFQQVFASEAKKLMGQMGVQDKFKLTEVKRTRDKDKVLSSSGLPITMANGFFYVDLDDSESIDELLSVMPDQSGSHDDLLDATINAYSPLRASNKLKPGFM